MPWDDEKQEHGAAEEIISVAPSRLQRPLTADEKLAATTIDVVPRESSSEVVEHSSPPVAQDNGILAKLRSLEAALDRRFGVESHAIDRKRAEDKQPVSWYAQLNMALLWASGNLNLSLFATGFIAREFSLSLRQSIVIVIFGSVLGGAVGGFCATLGPATGLRQISIGRYSMGWYPNKIIAALNIIQQIGWSAVGCITSGLALQAVSGGHISIAVGIIVVAVVSLAVSFVGLRAILVYERYAWLIYFVIFMVIFGETGRYADNTTPAQVAGAELSGAVLSLLAIAYGSSASWAAVTSDYYVHYPADVSRTKVFLMTTFGIAVPTSISMVAGCVVASALNNRPEWAAAYQGGQGLGFLIQTMLYPRGFANFILVMLVLSGINMNIINTYSGAISCQQFARPCARVPRFVWIIACFCVVVALALAGRNSLLTYLENFLALLGYWCTSYFVIVFTEHYVFRRNDFANYDLEGWNDPARLPIGIGGITAFGLAIVAWVMGMDETWYVGPLARTIGGGGDVGNEFALVVTLLAYLPARGFELKWIGR